MDWWDQEKLAQAQVMVVGCGALGNEVLKNLALVGLGKIFMVDFDIIDASNLTRSVLFRMSDIGKRKVEVTAERVKELNPDIKVIAFHSDIVHQIGLGVFRRMNAVISCLDSREARMGLSRHCWRVGKPLIDGGLMMSEGQLRIFKPPDGPCYECTLNEKDYQLINQRYACTGLRREDMQLGRVPTGTTIASIIGAMQAQEAIKIIHGMPVSGGEGIIYNSMTRQFYLLKYKRRENCYGHERYESIIPLEAKSSQLTIGDFFRIVKGYFNNNVVIYLDRDIVIKLTCLVCHEEIDRIKDIRHLKTIELICPNRQSQMLPERTHIVDSVLLPQDLTLAKLGIPQLHILKVTDGTKFCFFEITGDEENVITYQ